MFAHAEFGIKANQEKGKTMTEDRILEHVRRQERNHIRSISWISIGVAILYVCGYVWRIHYYSRLGIPVLFVDFPFPEIIVPKVRLFAFMASVLAVIAYENYYDFYTRKKRLQRAKAMGIDAPLEKLYEYAFQKNSSSANKTNYTVFCEFLTEYIKANPRDNPDRKFSRDDFDSDPLNLFKDVPSDLKSSFVPYCIGLFDMGEPEVEQTFKDTLGLPPEGSKLYKKTQTGLFYILLASCVVLVIIYDVADVMILTFIYMGLGMIVGIFLVKVSKVDARWQMWHSIFMSIVVLVFLSGIDGYFTAQSELKKIEFPIAQIVQTDGKEQTGILLASFDDGYILAVSDPNDIYTLRKFHKHSVASLNYTTMRRVNQDLEMLKKRMKEDEEKSQALKEELRIWKIKGEKLKNSGPS